MPWKRTANEIAAEYGVHPNQIAQWKKQALDGLPSLFSSRSPSQEKDAEDLTAALYQQIGQLKVELDWPKKNQGNSVEDKRRLIDPSHPQLSIGRQCELLGLARSSYYYQPMPVSEEDLLLMRLLYGQSLADLLQALYPDRTHTTKVIQRQRQVQAQQTFGKLLTTLVDDLPPEAKGRQWLLTSPHGKEALFRRYKNEPPEIQAHLLWSVRLVIDALQQLPVPPQSERLALFAQRLSGDPHCFDINTLSGRLLQQALADLSQRNQIVANTESLADQKETSSLPLLEQEQQRLFLYAEAGLLVDTISSTVAVFHLTKVETNAGFSDPWIEHAGKRILVLPLRQLLTWNKIHPMTKHVYLFENPQVFEKIVGTLKNLEDQQYEKSPGQLPTLVCTSGWPSVAALQLLTAIVNACPNVTFHYSGDFDLQGLRIATHLLTRYPNNCQLWHFDPPSYLSALHIRAANLESNEYPI